MRLTRHVRAQRQRPEIMRALLCYRRSEGLLVGTADDNRLVYIDEFGKAPPSRISLPHALLVAHTHAHARAEMHRTATAFWATHELRRRRHTLPANTRSGVHECVRARVQEATVGMALFEQFPEIRLHSNLVDCGEVLGAVL
jgi:hypothetical protein